MEEALERLQCPYTWEGDNDGVIYLELEERAQVLDRLSILCPKNWKRVLDFLQVAYSEAIDQSFSKAKSCLKDAYTGILEPLAELYACGACIFYRDAVKHVLDATWANIVWMELLEDNEDCENSPEGQALRKFIDSITPLASFNYQQRAAIYAIRAHLSYDCDTWIQKAIFLSPAEAQWYIDFAYLRWGEDPLVPHLPYASETDYWIVIKAFNLVQTHSSPSHFVKGGFRDVLLKAFDEAEEMMRALGKRPPKIRPTKAGEMFPHEMWILDMELLRLMARTAMKITHGIAGLSQVKCKKGRLHKKKCVCLSEWERSVIQWMVTAHVIVGTQSPATPADCDVPVYPMLQAALVRLDAGDVDDARDALQAVLAKVPHSQYVHMRMVAALTLTPNRLHEQKELDRAMAHVRKCKNLYPYLKDYVEECAMEARELAAAAAAPKPVLCVRKAGRRR